MKTKHKVILLFVRVNACLKKLLVLDFMSQVKYLIKRKIRLEAKHLTLKSLAHFVAPVLQV